MTTVWCFLILLTSAHAMEVSLSKASAIRLSDKIKTVVVLMEENRSFDQVFGYYPGVNGLTGKECNPVSTIVPNSPQVCVTDTAQFIAACDANHDLTPTTYKIFGAKAVQAKNFTDPAMVGFVEREGYDGNNATTNYCGVMDMFSPPRVPVLTSLASEFAIMDRFFASVPGPTWPNRMFFLSATSEGSTETGAWYNNSHGKLFPQKTIFDQITEIGGTWKNYYNDTPWEAFMETLAYNPENAVPMHQFFEDARLGALPTFSWINPRLGVNLTQGVGSNDQHPDHDFSLGEAYYKDVYEALRASPQWNETLFIITYDEHGGFYDHVPTPIHGVPSPGPSPVNTFAFDRLGVRIPALLISPWIQKGVVVSAPPDAQKPTKASEYDLTSIMASMRKILPGMQNVPPLTNRDAWAGTFEHVLEALDEPRTDCPLHLPDAFPPSLGHAEREAQLPVNSLQAHILTVNTHLAGLAHPSHIVTQRDASEWANMAFLRHAANVKRWKESKRLGPTQYSLIMMPWNKPGYLTQNWNVSTATLGVDVVNTIWTVNGNETLCFDGGSMAVGSTLGVSWCFPSADPSANRDPSQRWVWKNDGTIRPFGNASVCVTTSYYAYKNAPMTLKECDGGVEQSFAYFGVGYPGMDGDTGVICNGGGIQLSLVSQQ